MKTHMMPEKHKAMEKDMPSGMKREMKKMKPAMKSMGKGMKGWPEHFNYPGGFKSKQGT